MSEIPIHNYTSFFNREIMLYSFDDIKLLFPIPLKRAAWAVGLMFAYSVPLVFILGIPTSFYGAIIYFAPPILGSVVLNKKIWSNRTVFDLLLISVKYLSQPKIFTGTKSFIFSSFRIRYTVTVSRLKDHYYVYKTRNN